MPRSHQENCASSPAPLVRAQRATRIRELNDRFRASPTGGIIMITPSIRDLGGTMTTLIASAVRTFDQFDGGNDPYREHDFGALTVGEHRVFWKIDYYDRRLEFGSPDPADPQVTMRVLTIMLAADY